MAARTAIHLKGGKKGRWLFMANALQLHVIAHIHNDFATKFGIPRQSGLVDNLQSTIIFEPEYRNPDAVRGLEQFSHIWLLWQFSESIREQWSPTVRPPRLGGNTRMGVFATRSPFRPNPLGLSSVQLEKITIDEELGPILYVSGADLMNGTPIYDIKPYLPYTDSHPMANSGFACGDKEGPLQVDFPAQWLDKIPVDKRNSLLGVLAQDPRPAYQDSAERIYGFLFAGLEIRFSVENKLLTVCEVKEA